MLTERVGAIFSCDFIGLEPEPISRNRRRQERSRSLIASGSTTMSQLLVALASQHCLRSRGAVGAEVAGAKPSNPKTSEPLQNL
jgi:hypothetical protein